MEKNNQKISFILKIMGIIFLFSTAVFAFNIAPNYQKIYDFPKDIVRFVIDDKDVTTDISGEFYIKDDVIMLSEEATEKFFENIAVYYDEKYDTAIITSNKAVGKIKLGESKVNINGEDKEIAGSCLFSGESLFVPISSLEEVTKVQIDYNEKVIATTPRAMSRVKIIMSGSKQKIKGYAERFSIANGYTYEDEILYIFDTENKKPEDYLTVRNARGDIGFMKFGEIDAKNILYFNQATDIQMKEWIDDIKYSLTWEYAENITPDRSQDEKEKTIDIISPTWIYMSDNNGNIKDVTDEKYLKWAKENNYSIWPALKNDHISIDDISVIMNDMKLRENLINNILEYAKKWEIQGINIDLEYMYMEDKEVFSEFVRELSAILRANEYIVSIDVTVAGGSEKYSLCYDRTALANAVDYIMLMAYDQYGSWSEKAGPNASLEWVEYNIKEMLSYENVDKDKLFLCVPFYSRYWLTDATTGKVIKTYAVDMKTANSYLEQYKDVAVWDDAAGQYYIESTSNGKTFKMWIDNNDALKEKIELINKYDLAGIASWRWGFEDKDTWELIDKTMDVQ